MIKLRVENVWTEISCDSLAYNFVRDFLTYDEECLIEDNRFLTGLLDVVLAQLTAAELPFEVSHFSSFFDEREDFSISDIDIEEDYLENIKLRDYQVSMVKKSLYFKRGIVESPPGSGKTEMAAAISKWLYENGGTTCLTIVPGVNSMKQTVARFKSRGVSNVIGIGGGHDKEIPSGSHVVAVVNTLYSWVVRKSNLELRNQLDSIGAMIFMESHHVPSRMWSTIGQYFDVPYRIGLSATPFETSEDPSTAKDYRLIGLSGNVIAKLPDYVLMNRNILTTPEVHMIKVTKPKLRGNNWHYIRRNGVTHNSFRNSIALDLINSLMPARVLVLVNEVNHAERVAKDIKGKVHLFTGGSKLTIFNDGELISSEQVPVEEVVEKLVEEDHYVLIGTTAIHEDFDLPSANVLLVLGAGKAFRGVIQRAGRVFRTHVRDDGSISRAFIVDFFDSNSFVLRNQSIKRKSMYINRFSKAEKFSLEYHDEVSTVIEKIKPFC